MIGTNWRRGGVLAVTGIALMLAGCTTTVRKHPEFAKRRAKIANVAVVPPDVEVVRVVFKGDNQPLNEEAARIRTRLPDLIAAAMRKQGFTVKEAGLDEQHFADKPDLRFQTTQLQDAFARADQQMFKVVQMSKSEAENYKTTLGTDVIPIADHADVDALVVAKMNGFKKSGGEIAKDVAITVLIAVATLGNAVATQPTKGASLQVALIDGTTGDILWATRRAPQATSRTPALGRWLSNCSRDFRSRARATLQFRGTSR